MRKAEQKVWDAMKRAAKRHAPRAWMQRVENLAGDGMPDVYVTASIGQSGSATPSWVELKAATLPKRATTKLQMKEGVRPSQINWHLKAQTKGVRSYVLIRIAERMDEPLLIKGHLADGINRWCSDECYAYATAIGWEQIFGELIA